MIQKQPIVSARARGRNGGRPSKQNEKSEMVMTLYDSGMKITDIVRNTDLSRSTVNRIIKNHSDKSEKDRYSGRKERESS